MTNPEYYPGLEAIQVPDKHAAEAQPGLIPNDNYYHHHGYQHNQYPPLVTHSHPPPSTGSPGTTTVYSASYPAYQNPDSQTPGQSPPRKRPAWILPAGAILLAIVVGVIGGIVGWKVTEGNQPCTAAAAADTGGSSGSGSNSPCSSPSTAGASKTIRANSALTVTGYRYVNDFQLRLFYQSPNNSLFCSIYDSQFAQWSVPKLLNLGSASPAAADTALAATTIIWGGTLGNPGINVPQTQLFYRGSSNVLMGQNFALNVDAGGNSDSVSEDNRSYGTGSGSQIGSLWPSVVTQTAAGKLYEVPYNNSYQSAKDLSLANAEDTPIVVLPLTADHTGAELRVFYRHQNGKLFSFNRKNDSTVDSSSGATPYTLPEDAPLAGFSTARGDGTKAVNTYLLWQDKSLNGTGVPGGVQFVYQDNSGWNGPLSDSVFADADLPTHLACLTAAMTGSGTTAGATVPLASDVNMNMCYFQAGGLLKEVHYDGSKWRDMGFVRMP